jgi:hypothetical protein
LKLQKLCNKNINKIEEKIKSNNFLIKIKNNLLREKNNCIKVIKDDELDDDKSECESKETTSIKNKLVNFENNKYSNQRISKFDFVRYNSSQEKQTNNYDIENLKENETQLNQAEINN